MISKVWAQVGSSFQQIGGECPGSDWVQMLTQRPLTHPTWVATSNGTWVEPRIIPSVVSRFQGREAMRQWVLPSGQSLFEAVESLMASDQVSETYKNAWLELQEFQRHSPMLIQMSQLFGLTSEDLDQLFINADSIVV